MPGTTPNVTSNIHGLDEAQRGLDSLRYHTIGAIPFVRDRSERDVV